MTGAAARRRSSSVRGSSRADALPEPMRSVSLSSEVSISIYFRTKPARQQRGLNVHDPTVHEAVNIGGGVGRGQGGDGTSGEMKAANKRDLEPTEARGLLHCFRGNGGTQHAKPTDTLTTFECFAPTKRNLCIQLCVWVCMVSYENIAFYTRNATSSVSGLVSPGGRSGASSKPR